ncbi:hypothetical protein ABMA46_10055 [Mesorhizobium sp. CN5-321]|uniref:hypothetical protein n=1 Tax=Mesorhizobium hunchu TaxID=3157708 RepID=UPI0032B8599C
MMADKIPDEIMREASRIWADMGFINDRLNQVPVLARTLMARDTAVRKECAEIARVYAEEVLHSQTRETAEQIATAIEATIGGRDEQC